MTKKKHLQKCVRLVLLNDILVDYMSTLYLVSTPIGNLEDITIRALRTLFSADVIACEDTRVTGKLLELLADKYPDFSSGHIKPVFVSYHDENEQLALPTLIAQLESGKHIALVSDAGTPLISDPGYRIVVEARKRSLPIVVVPGVSATLTALVGSGLPTNTFTFVGYFPEKENKRIVLLKEMQQSHALLPSTYVCYVAPHKLPQTLLDMKQTYGDIAIVIARELTKIHEEFWQGTISEAEAHFQNPKGEFVLLFHL